MSSVSNTRRASFFSAADLFGIRNVRGQAAAQLQNRLRFD